MWPAASSQLVSWTGAVAHTPLPRKIEPTLPALCAPDPGWACSLALGQQTRTGCWGAGKAAPQSEILQQEAKALEASVITALGPAASKV